MTGLTHYDKARLELAEARTFKDVKSIRDKAVAMAEYAKQAKDTEMECWAREIRARAERKCGEKLREMKANGEIREGSRPQLSSATTVKLPDLGITRDQSSRWQKKAAIPEADFEAQLAAKQAMRATTYSHDSLEYYTPAQFVEAAREVMGGIDLDPASCEDAQKTVRASRYYSERGDLIGEGSARVRVVREAILRLSMLSPARAAELYLEQRVKQGAIEARNSVFLLRGKRKQVLRYL